MAADRRLLQRWLALKGQAQVRKQGAEDKAAPNQREDTPERRHRTDGEDPEGVRDGTKTASSGKSNGHYLVSNGNN
jgi:hypothetical protein